MAESDRSLGSLMWQLRLWWMVPAGLMAVLFVLLLLFADATGDAPFIYTLF
jgi:Family of unknown function (DUF5989)